MMKKWIGRKVTQYLNKKLDDGHDALVYGLSNYWGSRCGLGRILGVYDAAWFIQERLIQEYGYQECPSCYWATHRPHQSEWCTQQQLCHGDTD